MLPTRLFPCQDTLGIASTEDVDFDTNGMKAVGAFYAEEDAEIAPGAEIAGSVITGGSPTVEGGNVRIAAVPSHRWINPTLWKAANFGATPSRASAGMSFPTYA